MLLKLCVSIAATALAVALASGISWLFYPDQTYRKSRKFGDYEMACLEREEVRKTSRKIFLVSMIVLVATLVILCVPRLGLLPKAT